MNWPNARAASIAVSILISAVLFQPCANAAGIDRIDEALKTGNIGAGAEQREGKGAAAEKDAAKEDLATKLDALLAEIEKIRPGIDSVPVELAKPVQAGSDEASIEKHTVALRKYRRATLIMNAFKTFEAGKYEEAFKEFEFVYSEFVSNEKALCFMVLCRAKQKKLEEAVELAEELLGMLKSDGELEALYDKIVLDVAAIGEGTGETNLDAKELAGLNDRLEEELKKVLGLYPKIANIAEKPKKARESNNKIDDEFYEFAYERKAGHLKMLQAGKKLFDGGNYAGAYAAFKKRFDERPVSVRAIYYMALCKMKMGRPDEALKLTASLIEIIKGRQELRDSREEVAGELGLDKKDGKKGDDKKKDRDDAKKDEQDEAKEGKKPGREDGKDREKATEGSGFRKNGLLDVPTRAQCAPENGSLGGSLCGPTSLAMTLEFYGIKKTTLNVARETRSIDGNKQFVGTYCENIAAAAKRFMPGSYMKNDLTTDDLAKITSSGKPVIVNVNTQGYWPGGHYMVCTGVKNGTVYVNDPGNGSTRTYSLSQFNAQWATRSNRAVIVQP